MDKISGSKVFIPCLLNETDKNDFIDKLYALHCKIFSGVNKSTFIHYVVDSPAKTTKICIFKNNEGQFVGYCAAHLFEKRVLNKKYFIFRAEAGLLPQYRRHNTTLMFGFMEAFKFRFSHPFARLYYLGSFVHPSVFHMFTKFFSKIYPSSNQSTPGKIVKLMCTLADEFQLPVVDSKKPLVRKIGWITNESEEEKQHWRQKLRPDVRLYLDLNPGYGDGHGLLTLVPLGFINMMHSLLVYLTTKIRLKNK